MRKFIATIVSITLLLSPLFVSASQLNTNKHKKTVVVKAKPHRAAHAVVVPRHRLPRRVVVITPRPRVYMGYGHFHSSNDAWRWLAFTSITLKLLDNVNEQAQREHEAAQVKATTAAVGQKISWDTPDATGFVVATKQGKDANGLTCREFQQQIIVGGKTEDAFGRACLRVDGSWEIVDTAKTH